jgi:hypothetical protein
VNALITIEPIDEEPRVLDTALAEALGVARPRNIRATLSIRTAPSLNAAASFAFGGRKPDEGRHQTSTLNKEQVFLVCLLSRTEKAKPPVR